MKIKHLIPNNRKNISRLLCIAALSSCSMFSYAQQQQVNLTGNNLSLKAIFQQIEKQTNLSVDYKSKDLDDALIISKVPKTDTVIEAIQQLLMGTGCEAVFSKGHIIIKKKVSTIQRSKKVSGRVVDKNGEPIIGATIAERGTTNGTITNFDGNFTLTISEDSKLDISYIGYKSVHLSNISDKRLSVILHEDTQTLDELVVVGYGTQKKVNLTGAVETISNEVIENRPLKSATDALQGTALGVTVASAAGEPGKFSKIKIRGNSSLNSGGVLVLIDGMPGNINQINPQDIQSISVLKDAASSAIYGSRAAEGVILVTTKMGSSSKTKVEYSTNISFNTPTRIPESTTAEEHARLANLAFTNAGLSPAFSDEALQAIKDPNIVSLPAGKDWIYTADVDWIDMMMDHSFQQNHNLTVSRSQENIKYLFSAGWLDQNGMFSEYGPDNYDRFNLRSNVNLDIIKDKLNFDSRIVFTRSDKKYSASRWTIPNLVFKCCGPNMPIYDANGNYARFRMQGNPIQVLKEGGEGSNFTNVIDGIFTLTYNPIKDLSLKAVGGGRFTSENIKDWSRSYGKYGPNGLISEGAGNRGPNSIKMFSNNTRYFTGQLLAEYNKKFKDHSINMLGGWSAETQYYRSLGADRVNIIGNSLPALSLGSTEGWTNSANETHWALLSGFMRLNYSYKDRYLFEGNFRADGSSRFSSQNKWGFFPSFSVGWRITEEEFMKKQKVFSNLKFRASWGQLGNQNGLGLYDHIPQYNVNGYYPFNNGLAQWAVLSMLPSENRSWETIDMKNIALEMGFLNNRLSFSYEYYIKKNKDMLVNIEVPSAIGIKVPTGNYGELEVKGWETSLRWQDRVKDFDYFVALNLSDHKDKLVDYGVEFSGFTSGVNQLLEGYSIGSIFGFESDGYFQTTEDAKNSPAFNRAIQDAGDIRYIDQDGDGKITAPNDLVYLGNTQPRYEFGIQFGGSYKGFDFSALIQGVGKRNFYLNGEAFQPFRDTWNNFSYTYYSDYWTPENPNATLPRLYASVKHNYQISTHWIQNAAYARLKNLQIGYTLPKTWLKKMKVEKVRIYFSGENLFEYSKLFKYYDPEINTDRGDMYPIMRNYSIGLNISL